MYLSPYLHTLYTDNPKCYIFSRMKLIKLRLTNATKWGRIEMNA